MGRPLKYGENASTSADRVEAYRAKIQDSGLVRMELLVDSSVKNQIAALAQEQNVPVGLVGAHLLYQGLAQAQTNLKIAAQITPPCSTATDFFNKRKQTLKEIENGKKD